MSVRLELNEWNGATEPRAVLGTLYDPAEAPAEDAWRASDAEWTERLAAALDGPLALPSQRPERNVPTATRYETRRGTFASGRGARWWIAARASGLAAIGELASSGERVLVLCADALWRRGIVESAVHPGRFGGDTRRA